MKKADHEGIYYIKRAPTRMKRHNAESWGKIEKVMAKSGGKEDFDALAIAVKDHRHGTQSARYPYQFITYCIRNGWLQRVK
jgi:hypothetical protein